MWDNIITLINRIELVDILEFVGTFAFAISGVRLASAKEIDIFGALVIGLFTAIGGGTIRDLCLGVTPFWMDNSFYLTTSLLALLFVWIWHRQIVRLNTTFFIFDMIGLGLFVVVGAEKTLALGFAPWVAVIMGTITGAFGGMLRDVLINEIPLIFRREIYALPCIIGGLFYVSTERLGLESWVNELTGAFIVMITRYLAVRFKWRLPIMKGES